MFGGDEFHFGNCPHPTSYLVFVFQPWGRVSAMADNRVLFVDDEPGQRLTLPAILRIHGFEVCTAATVAQALAEMTTQHFDVLISDLNIGEPGDGFTVVSAMRRTQPDCINFIITGFPAFESALAAIQRQVDDVLVKPARIENLIETIRERLRQRHPGHHAMELMRLSELLRGCAEEILHDVVREMESEPTLGSIPMIRDEAGYFSALLAEIAHQMDSAAPDEPTDLARALSREHGARRSGDGYSIGMLISETRTLEDVVYDKVRQRLLLLDTSNLVLDLKRLNHSLNTQLQESVQAFWDQAARFSSVAKGTA
jgi:ActR/RegA family two-component response regulator